jgi:chemotaxis protein methyltransferase CheR
MSPPEGASRLEDTGTPPDRPRREFELSDRNFEFISRFIRSYAGIELTEAKRDLVYSRLVRRLRQLGMRSFNEYCKLLESGSAEEKERCVNALSTNLTSFFREPHHFRYLREKLVPALVSEKTERRITIWSAGCSTGEEPYSIAITMAESLPRGWDYRILATDLDSSVIEKGSAGNYSADRIAGLDAAVAKRWFLLGKGGNAGRVQVKDELRRHITFRQLNLLERWPMRRTVDIIFCRNTIIYFSKETQKALFDRFHEILRPGGHVFIGHSESLYKVTESFRLLGQTIYQRIP